jgi:hypothetical protein
METRLLRGLSRFGISLVLLSIIYLPSTAPVEAQSRTARAAQDTVRTERARPPARTQSQPTRQRTREAEPPARTTRTAPPSRTTEPARTNPPERQARPERGARTTETPARTGTQDRQARTETPARTETQDRQTRTDRGRTTDTPTRTAPDTRTDRTRGAQEPARQSDRVRGETNQPGNTRGTVRDGRGANPRPNPPAARPAPVRQGPIIVVPRVYRTPPIYRAPVYVRGIDLWPWETRMRRGWTPRYQFRQTVYTEAGWGSRRADSRLEIVTVYRQRLLSAARSRADLEVRIDEIHLYEDGHYLGRINRIPGDMSRMRAVMYRNGRVDFDRTPYIVGNPRDGFEMLMAPYSERHLVEGYVPLNRIRTADLDFRSGRAHPTRYSRLYHPHDFTGMVPIALLPEDGSWLFDYAYDIAGYAPHVRGYVGYRNPAIRTEMGVHLYRMQDDFQFRTQTGVSIILRRDLELRRL